MGVGAGGLVAVAMAGLLRLSQDSPVALIDSDQELNSHCRREEVEPRSLRRKDALAAPQTLTGGSESAVRRSDGLAGTSRSRHTNHFELGRVWRHSGRRLLGDGTENYRFRH